MQKTLVYGYGNLGRKDDGLGVACAVEIEKWAAQEDLEWLDVETNYQLNIEDAEIISNYDRVYFVDASLEAIDDVLLTDVLADKDKIEFSMHAISPAYVLHLCHDMFDKTPKTKLLHIKGYDWDFVEGMTEKALVNLRSALAVLKLELRSDEK